MADQHGGLASASPRSQAIPATSSGGGRARLEYIDGLRALAALWVAVHHVIETSIPRATMGVPIIGPVISSLFFGQFPVMIFLMLSGFCLYYPCVRKNRTSPELRMTYGAFMRRRATRILPPYFSALFFCLCVSAIPGFQVGRWESVGTTRLPVVVSHLLLVHNLIPNHATKIDYPMWSIGLEWQLYLLFPLVVWSFRRHGALVVLLASLGLAALIRSTYHRMPTEVGAIMHDGPFSYMEIFAGGMIAAAITVRGGVAVPKFILGAIAIAGFLAVRLGSGNGLVHDTATGAAAFSLLLLAADERSALARVLSTPWLVRIGIFSYSFYLVHAPLVHLFWLGLSPLRLSQDALFFALAVVCMPIILVLSYWFHCLFERPFMRIQSDRLQVASGSVRA